MNKLDREEFFKKYRVEEDFERSDLKWETLQAIYEDYRLHEKDIQKHCVELEKYIRSNMSIPIHSLRCRWKDPEHLIEKIIRKRGKEQKVKYRGIDVHNYKEIIQDLIGVRILMLAKEEWNTIFDELIRMFPSSDENSRCYMADVPIAYTRYGDRDIFQDRIHVEHSNKGYRSQHYIVKFQEYYCEIQVRTLAEEVYGEFDHKVKYPYRDDNKFLIRYTTTLSQLLGSVDELISTCFQMQEDGWENCNQYYEEDKYVDWKHISQRSSSHTQKETTQPSYSGEGMIDMREYADSIILRKD